MKKKIHESFERVAPPVDKGLTAQQVRLRRDAGAVNAVPIGLTPSVGQILRKNILTLFNLVNAVLALLLVFTGTAHARVTAVGADSFAIALTAEAVLC